MQPAATGAPFVAAPQANVTSEIRITQIDLVIFLAPKPYHR